MNEYAFTFTYNVDSYMTCIARGETPEEAAQNLLKWAQDRYDPCYPHEISTENAREITFRSDPQDPTCNNVCIANIRD